MVTNSFTIVPFMLSVLLKTYCIDLINDVADNLLEFFSRRSQSFPSIREVCTIVTNEGVVKI